MRITGDQLEQQLRAGAPAARLVLPRILRRVIKARHELKGLIVQVPHRKSLAIPREPLLDIVHPDEFGGTVDELPEIVLLVARPADGALLRMSREQALEKVWRLAFHAGVHAALEQPARFTQERVAELFDRIGQTAMDEVRAVLRREQLLLPPVNDLRVLVEFAALYLELRHFAPSLLEQTLPGCRDHDRLDALLAEELDVSSLLQQTRPQGAPDLPQHADDELPPAVARPPADRPERPRRTALALVPRLLRTAAKKTRSGNHARAAMLRTRCARATRGDRSAELRAEAGRDVDALAQRLVPAVHAEEGEAASWRTALEALLPWASQGSLTAEGRLFFDLQKVCVDHERGVHRTSIVPWLFSLGRTPIKHELPHHREVLIVRHLRVAKKRLPSVRLTGEDRERLRGLVEEALRRAEQRLRERFTPRIEGALDEVGLVAGNVPERVARRKIVEELCDRIVERGFLSIGQLRDAVSQNDLKLPDGEGLVDLLTRDRLLAADRALARALPGVYRRGDVYLRALQSLTALIFATSTGRFLVRWVVIPFGGAFVALEGVQHMAGPPLEKAFGVSLHLVGWTSTLLLGAYVVGLMRSGRVRSLSMQALRAAGRGLRFALLRLPARLLQVETIRRLLASPRFRDLARWFLKPAALALLLCIPLLFTTLPPRDGLLILAAVFLALNLFLNSRLGGTVEEIGTDWTSRTWARIRHELLAGLLRLVIHVFKRAVEGMERALYLVDEWLRFRSGEGRLTFVTKAALSAVWFVVSYVVRVFVNLIFEPQINPVKHFPVVTVSHKIVLPMMPKLTALTAAPLEPVLGAATAQTLMGSIVFFSPGVFGFLMWEFKENWRLFAANRPSTLKAVRVGRRGETMLQYMKPGFHSGTLPRTYAQLAKAERKSLWTGRRKRSEKLREKLEHARHDLRVFVERNLVALLEESRWWSRPAPRVGEVEIGTNVLRVELGAPSAGAASAWLQFEEQSGKLLVGLPVAGWVEALEGDDRRAFRSALVGFFHLAGADLIRDQIRRDVGPGRPYDIADDGLQVWPGPGYRNQLRYPIDDDEAAVFEAQVVVGEARGPLPGIPRQPLLFGESPVSWMEWKRAWSEEGSAPDLAASAAVLPSDVEPR